MNQSNTEKKNNPIQDFTEQEFQSFLYSERDRENSLSQYQGWNTWALMGAIITVLSVAYASLKAGGQFNWMRSTYYATGAVSYFLAYHSCFKFIDRDRGHDLTRVRLLKEMTPWADSVLAILTAITAIILILIYDCPSNLYWSWVVVLVVQFFVVTVAMVNGNKLVPFYFTRPYFPNLRWNMIYDGIAGGLFAWVGGASFQKASWCILNPEFEVGICIGAAAVLFYYFIRIKVENKVVEQFDAIIDRYLYVGKSKEDTFNEILCNRMGYGVLEVVEKDLKKVQEMAGGCEKKRQELATLKAKIQNGEYDIYQISKDYRQLKDMLKYLDDSLKQSDKLADRLKEMVKIAPILDHVTVINTVFDTNKELYSQVKAVQKDVQEVSSLLQLEFDKCYCQKANAICLNRDCGHRSEPMDKNYIRQLRHSRLCTKAKRLIQKNPRQHNSNNPR